MNTSARPAIIAYRFHCHGNVLLNATPKSHRPWPVLCVGGKIHRYTGAKCPGVHLNPIDAPVGSSHKGGARSPIANRAMKSLINMAPYSLVWQFATQRSD